MRHAIRKERKRQAILEILRSGDGPMGSREITRALFEAGEDVSERTVRLYLKRFDEEGLTRSLGRRGRVLSAAGEAECGAFTLMQRLGYMSALIDQMTYGMNFDLELRTGSVVVNTALMSKEVLEKGLPLIRKVFEKGYGMGILVALLAPGERVGDITVPPGRIGFCTVCSVTLNGVLLKHGVPTRSIFSGLLELADGEPVRFSELINYDGTSLDPLELFIRGGMTDYLGAIHTGNGRIGAGFREAPAGSYERVVHLADRAERIGLGGFLRIGRPERELFNIPVRQGCCGAVVIGGLNPLAVLEESGERVDALALSGFLDFHRLFPYDELDSRLKTLPET